MTDIGWYGEYVLQFLLAQVGMYMLTSYTWTNPRIFLGIPSLRGMGSLVLLSAHFGIWLSMVILTHKSDSIPCWLYKLSAVVATGMIVWPQIVLLLVLAIDFYAAKQTMVRRILDRNMNNNSVTSTALYVVVGLHIIFGLVAAVPSLDKVCFFSFPF